MRTTRLFLALATAAIVTPAFAQAPAAPAPNYPPVVTKLVADTKKEVKTIKIDEFKAAYDKKALGVLIDVRDPPEYADGHIAGAINISRGLLEFRIWKALGFPNAVDMNQRITLYCLTGGRCALATKSLMGLGFTNVVSSDMKFEDWEKAGYPVAKPAPKK